MDRGTIVMIALSSAAFSLGLLRPLQKSKIAIFGRFLLAGFGVLVLGLVVGSYVNAPELSVLSGWTLVACFWLVGLASVTYCSGAFLRSLTSSQVRGSRATTDKVALLFLGVAVVFMGLWWVAIPSVGAAAYLYWRSKREEPPGQSPVDE